MNAPARIEYEVGKTIGFEIQTPATDEQLANNVRYSMSLGLPEFDGEHLKTLTVVANGPSARGITFDGVTVALNGSISLFDPEHPPTYWVGCDPQSRLADLIVNPSHDTIYIVASKCHPDVFKRLEGFDVRLWHINDQEIPGVRKVPCAVSVTICALMLFHRMGWRKIDVYGWDICFADDGSHHAGAGIAHACQSVEIEVGDRTFVSTHTWAAEANDALNVIPVLEWCGTEVNIHGDGMLSAIRAWKIEP